MLRGQTEQLKEPGRLKRLPELPPCHLSTHWRCTGSELGLGQPDQAGQEPDRTTMGNARCCHLLHLWLGHGLLGSSIHAPAPRVCYLLPLLCLLSSNILLTSTRPLIQPPSAHPQKGKLEAVHQVTEISSEDNLNAILTHGKK